MKVKITRTAAIGLHSGTTMRMKILVSPAPSMRAASISSSGIATMNWRTMKMPKASAARGRITPQ